MGLCIGFFFLIKKDGFSAWAGKGRLPACALAFTLPLLLTVAYIAALGALRQMGADLLWPFCHYSSPNKVPFGYIQSDWLVLLLGSTSWRAFVLVVSSPFFIVSALPIFGLFNLGYSAYQFCQYGKDSSAWRYYIVVSAVHFSLFLSTVAAARPDSTHFILQALLYCLVLGWMSEADQRVGGIGRTANCKGYLFNISSSRFLLLTNRGREMGYH